MGIGAKILKDFSFRTEKSMALPEKEHLLSATFSHLDPSGQASMVNVSEKPISLRKASARAVCAMQPSTADAIKDGAVTKGAVLSVARLAGIMAAKRTDELIPLCHRLAIDSVSVDFNWRSAHELEILVHAQATARTGVEMEALCGASIAALTVYDMCKSIDPTLHIINVQLLSKSGGVHGDYRLNE
jgi:cyclic pyranopterin phosphate synthase